MTSIEAILIFFKEHLFPPIRMIESKLGGRVRANMEIQNCSNHSNLISNLAPMATNLICFKIHNFPNHVSMSDYTETYRKAYIKYKTTKVTYCVPSLQNMLQLL